MKKQNQNEKPNKYNSENPNPIDKHVGARIRLRRTLLGYSQDRLADSLGITFQQVQKYENAMNRISASRLYDLSKVLGVDVQFFYKGLKLDKDERSYDPKSINKNILSEVPSDILQNIRVKKLIRNFCLIKNTPLQSSLYESIRTAARQDD